MRASQRRHIRRAIHIFRSLEGAGVVERVGPGPVALLGLAQAVQALANIPQEERGFIFLIRLAAFAIILAAIVRKNRPAA